MDVVIKALQFILSLSILVVLHEFGHYFFAKLFGIRVEKFYLFFNPGFSLFKFRIGETEYGMGWIPFGGYVKISGMVDESMDSDQLSLPPQDFEFRSRPAWQRLLVMIGGVMMNLITAIVVYVMVSYSYPNQYIDNKNVYSGYAFSELAQEIGFRNGDKIINVDGNVYGNYKNIIHDIIITNPDYVDVLRENRVVRIDMDDKYIPEMLKDQGFMDLRIPMIIGEVLEDGPASGILTKGDRLVSVNGVKASFNDEFSTYFGLNKNNTVLIGFLRGDKYLTSKVTINDSGKLGVHIDVESAIATYNITEKRYTFAGAIPEGWRRTKAMFASYIDQMKMVFNPTTGAYKQVGSVISMGSVFPSFWDWQTFWNLTALYSVILAVMNILPIPALDGGHVVFLIYEVIARREPSEKFLQYAQTVGMLLLLALIVFAMGNDIYKLFT